MGAPGITARGLALILTTSVQIVPVDCRRLCVRGSGQALFAGSIPTHNDLIDGLQHRQKNLSRGVITYAGWPGNAFAPQMPSFTKKVSSPQQGQQASKLTGQGKALSSKGHADSWLPG